MLRSLALLLIAAPVFAGAAIPVTQEMQACPVLMTGYRHTVSWYQGKNRVKIEATQACGARYGHPLELQNVKLTIESNQTVIARFFSSTGTLSPREGRLIMGQAARLNGPSAAFTNLLIDFKTGEARAPSGFYLRLKKSEPLGYSAAGRVASKPQNSETTDAR
jgi:hypothetical protein